MVTQQRLKSELEYNEETGHFIWRRGRNKGKRAGSPIKNGYRTIRIGGRRGTFFYEHRLAFLYVSGNWPPADVDHINRDRADNRFCNLRLATRSQNNIARPPQLNNTSGISGVAFNIGCKKWVAYLDSNYGRKHLGVFLTKEEAIKARLNAAKNLYGAFAPEAA